MSGSDSTPMSVTTHGTPPHENLPAMPQVADAQCGFAPRVLFLSATEPDIASGTPVILCDLLAHFPSGDAELLCEKKYQAVKRRQITLPHRVNRIHFPNCLWPFRRGHRVRQLLLGIALPWTVLIGCWRVLRLRPTCLVAIYWRIPWIIAAYLISRLCRVPLVYYVHDTLRENFDGLGDAFVGWLEAKSLRGARVMVLHPYLAEHYRQRYGIECIIVRQVIWREPLTEPPRSEHDGAAVIGFAGAIYDNNAQQLSELAAIVAANPRLRLKIWTDASDARLAELGITGERIEIGFEADHARLLQRLSGCDLLYLPLAFQDSGSLTTDALQYAFPTKSLDYLVAGPPILVHCPAHFELSRFFREHACAHVLNEGQPAALSQWLERWLKGGEPSPDAAAKRAAIKQFSPQENRRMLWRVLFEVATEKRGAALPAEVNRK